MITSAGAAYVGLASCSFFQVEIEDGVLADPVFLQFIWDENTMISIGDSYTSRFPNDNYKKELDRLITENRSDPAAINERLQEIIYKDFTKDDVVMLDGWLLSRTEARQCAIYNHLNPRKNNVN